MVRRALYSNTNRVLDTETVKLCLTKSTPYLWIVDLFGKSCSPVNTDNMFDQDVDSIAVGLRLLVNLKRFLVETRVDGNVGDFRIIVVVQLLDIFADTSTVSLDCGENQEILQVLIFAEWRWFEDDLLEQFNQLIRQIGIQECLYSDRDIIGIRAFGNCGSSDLELENNREEVYLIDELATIDAVLQDCTPQLWVSSLDEISRLMLEHLILVRDVHKLRIILALLICNESQVWISFLTVLADDERIVQGIFLEEFLGIVVAVDINLGKSVEDSRILRSGFQRTLEEGKKQFETIA